MNNSELMQKLALSALRAVLIIPDQFYIACGSKVYKAVREQLKKLIDSDGGRYGLMLNGYSSEDFVDMYVGEGNDDEYGVEVVKYLPWLLNVLATDESAPGAGDGEINGSNPYGGVAPYTYSIDSGATWQTSVAYTGLDDGTYDLMIQDSGGRIAHMPITVSEGGN
jgi:hypothetical protein